MISKLIKGTKKNTLVRIRTFRVFGKRNTLKVLQRMKFFVVRAAGLVC